MSILIRKIEQKDNVAMANVIRNVFIEHGINRPGTAFYDPCLDTMFEYHFGNNTRYFVAISENELLGGAGIYPTDGLPIETCELVKMYLLSSSRGKGIGRLLLEKCIETAKEMGYKKMYLETTHELNSAISMYEKFGFKYLENRMGESGHHSCGIFMLKELI